MKAVDPTVIQDLKLFLYGDPGSGKTTMAASAADDPRSSPVLWFDCAGNPESIRRRTNLDRFSIFKIEEPKDLNAPFKWLLDGQPMKHEFTDIAKELGVKLTPPYKAVVLDTATEYQRICLDVISGNSKKKLGAELNYPDQRMWGQALSQLTMMARMLFGLRMTVIITAQEKQELDKLTEVMTYNPALWGQARAEVPSYSLATMRLTRQSKMAAKDKKDNPEAYSVGYLDQVGKFLAKDQYGSLPPMIASPTVPRMLDMIYGPLTKSVSANEVATKALA